MKKASIKRYRPTDQGIPGKIRCEGLVIDTLELPHRKNKKGESCIPPRKEGLKKRYYVKWCYSPRFKKMMYLIQGVKGRTGVRFHSGNLAGDENLGWTAHSDGCVLLGGKCGHLYVKRNGVRVKQRAVLASKTALRRFEKHMGYKDFILEVINA